MEFLPLTKEIQLAMKHLNVSEESIACDRERIISDEQKSRSSNSLSLIDLRLLLSLEHLLYAAIEGGFKNNPTILKEKVNKHIHDLKINKINDVCFIYLSDAQSEIFNACNDDFTDEFLTLAYAITKEIVDGIEDYEDHGSINLIGNLVGIITSLTLADENKCNTAETVSSI